MSRPAFSGRQAQIAALLKSVDDASLGQGSVVLVEAPAGSGKTALIAEFRRRLSERSTSQSILQVQGNCSDGSGAANAYEPFAEALVGAATPGASREGRSKSSLIIELLKNVAPDLVSMLPVVGPAAAAVTKAAATTGQWWLAENADELEALSRTITSQFIDAFISIADTRGPLVITIENAHWCDPSSSALLSRLSRQVSDHQVVVVVTYRPEGVRAGHPLESSISEMRMAGFATRLTLENFTNAELSEYVDTRYGSDVAGRLTPWLYRHCGGHPLMVTSYLTLLEQRKALINFPPRQDGDPERTGGWRLVAPLADLPIPDSVEAVLTHRAQWLNEDQRKLMRMASVQGEDFLAVILSGMLAVDEDAIVTDLKEVERRHGLIAESTTDEWALEWSDGFAFEHELMRQMFYNTLTPNQKIRYHAAVGASLLHLVEQIPLPPRRLTIDTAIHLQEGRLWADAAEQYRRAARSCYLDGALDEATRLAEKGLVCVQSIPDPERRRLARLEAKTIQMLLICSELAWWDSPVALAGEPVLDLLRQAELAAETAADRKLTAELTFLRAKVTLLRHSLPEALRLFALAVEQARTADDELGEVIGLTELGHHTVGIDPALGLSQLTQAEALWEERLETFEGMVSPTRLSRHLARLQVTLGTAYFDCGDFDKSQHWLNRSVSVLRNYRMPDLQASMSSLHAQLLMGIGQFEEAKIMIDEALAMPAQHGEDSAQRSYLFSLLGKLFLEWEKPKDAFTPLARAFEQTQDSTNTAVLPLIRNYYCELLLCSESGAFDPPAAEALLDKTIKECGLSGFRRSEVSARMLMSVAYRRRGDVAGALEQSRLALDLLDVSGLLPTVRREEILFNRHLCLAAAGQVKEASEALQAAHTELMRKGERLSGKSARERFLNRVPLNRDILSHLG